MAGPIQKLRMRPSKGGVDLHRVPGEHLEEYLGGRPIDDRVRYCTFLNMGRPYHLMKSWADHARLLTAEPGAEELFQAAE